MLVVVVRKVEEAAMSEEDQKRFDWFKKMSPPQFDGDPFVDAQDFLHGCQEILQNLGLVESNGVDFTTFQLKRPPKRSKAEASDAVITGIVSVFHRDASVLFDSGSTYSYVPSYFVSHLDLPRSSIDIIVHVCTPVGFSVVVDCVYQPCVVTIRSYETSFNLLFLNMVDFDMILGMDWLFLYHVILDCHAKTMMLAMPRLARLEWRGSLGHTPSRVISFLKAQRMV
ncbi:uncharacterized protein [Nicotiana tomentosiformis]|uniref:uncharacterized protein n=1 Tax=Nicotiana tomentosiformis TaxID=4098 RepID=UPI00388CA73A